MSARVLVAGLAILTAALFVLSLQLVRWAVAGYVLRAAGKGDPAIC